MEAYCSLKQKELNTQAYKYFLKILGKPIVGNLRELNLMTKIYAYNYQLKQGPHDLDVIADLTGELMEALFWTIDDTSAPLLLIGGDLITTPGKSPPRGLDAFFTTGKVILKLSKITKPREKLNTLGTLLDEVKGLIESILIISKFEDFKEFTEKYIEMKRFWQKLRAQREEAIKRKLQIYKELESTTIFPLLYKPTETKHGLVTLLKQYNIKFLQGDLYNMKSIKLKLEELSNQLIVFHDRTIKETEEIIENNTNCKPGDIKLSNPFTLYTAVLNTVTAPSYKESWLRVNYLKSPAIRDILYDLKGLEDYCELGMDLQLAKTHHELTTVIPHEELEITISTKPDDMDTEQVKMDEAENTIHIEDTLEIEPVDLTTNQGGHNLPVLKTILQQPYSRAEALKNPLKTVKWAIPLQVTAPETSSACTPTSSSTSSTTSTSTSTRAGSMSASTSPTPSSAATTSTSAASENTPASITDWCSGFIF
jgi:hypothetical protein